METNGSTVKEISNLLRARYSMIYIVSHEERRVETSIEEVARERGFATITWSVSHGFEKVKQTKDGLAYDKYSEEVDPIQALKKVSDDKSKAVFVLRDFHAFMDDAAVRRWLRHLANQLHHEFKTVIILSPIFNLPEDLSKDVAVLDWPLPDRAALSELLNAVLDTLSDKAKKSIVVPKEKIIEAALGLTATEAENVFSKTLVAHGTLLVDEILKEKKQIVKKSGHLEFYEPTTTLEDVGGLEVLKEWTLKRRSAFTEEARKYGIPTPKGVILVGISGCGKSLIAKTIGKIWEMPLLRFDVGSIYGSLVGQSERSMALVLKTAESVAPCVTGNTGILLTTGEEILAKELEVNLLKGSIDIVAFDPNTKSIRPSKLKAVTKKSVGEHGCWQIVTPAGCCERSGNHLLLTQRGWVHVIDLQLKKDWIAFLGKYPTLPVIPNIKSLLPKNLRTVNGKFRSGKGGWTDSVISCLPNAIEPRYLYILGLCMADGSLNEDEIIHRSSNKKTIDLFCDVIESMFGKRPKVYPNNEPGHRAHKRDGTEKSFIAKFHSKIGASIFLGIRDRLLSLPPFLLASWLRGFTQGDGSIQVKTNRFIITQTRPSKKTVISVLRRLNFHRRFAGKNLTISGYNDFTRILTTLKSAWGPAFDKVATCQVGTKTQRSFHRGVKYDGNIVWSKVTAILQLNEDYVYDLHCETPHTYVGDGVIDHNCVLWVDECEKAFSGVGSSNMSDGGTTARVFGHFLTWLQEKTAPVFVVMTSNDVTALPAEFLRKGRFDEIFAVDLPSKSERLEIFKVHIKHRGRNPNLFDLDVLSDESERFNGAEIEQAIISALTNAFYEKREVISDDILNAIHETMPLSTTMQEKIEFLRGWVKGRARLASKKEEVKELLNTRNIEVF